MREDGKAPAAGLPARAKTAAMIGEDALVPPTWRKPFWSKVSKTATPVFGSATAATSLSVRREQPVSVCHDGFASSAEQPAPVPSVLEVLQTLSVQPRELLAVLSEVPPTEVTNCEAAG